MRLRPERRDLFLLAVDLLAAGSTALRARLVTGGFAVAVDDLLFEVAANGGGNRLPSLVSELLSNLYRLHPDAVPRTYGQAARVILLSHPALELKRAEQAEEAQWTRQEALAEQRRATAEAKALEQGRTLRVGRPRKVNGEGRKRAA